MSKTSNTLNYCLIKGTNSDSTFYRGIATPVEPSKSKLCPLSLAFCLQVRMGNGFDLTLIIASLSSKYKLDELISACRNIL